MVWIQHQRRTFKQPVMWSWKKENMLHILSLLVLPCLVSIIAEAKGRGGGNGVSLFICLREGRCSGLEVFILHALVTLHRLHSCHLVPLPPRLWRGERGRGSLNQAPRGELSSNGKCNMWSTTSRKAWKLPNPECLNLRHEYLVVTPRIMRRSQ